MALSLSQRFSIKRFTQGEVARESSVALNHRRIFILPNKAGIILLMLVVSINYSNSMGFVFTFLLASAAQTSTYFSFRNLSGLTVSSLKTNPCYLGQTTHVSFNIHETEGRERWAINANIDGFSIQVSHLKPHERRRISLSVKPNQRGLYSPNTLTLSTTFPFSIFRAWSPLLFDQQIIVFPTPISFNNALPILSNEQDEGSVTSQAVDAEEYAGFNPYQSGDHFRRVNWKAWGAGRGLFTNQFSAQQYAETWVDWSECSSPDVESKLS